MPPPVLTAKDPLRIPPTIQPVSTGGDGTAYFRIPIKEAEVQFHHDLPPGKIWGYDGQFPGPTFDVRRDQKIVVDFANELPDPAQYPYAITQLSGHGHGGHAHPHHPVGSTAIHLHGSPTLPEHDGWPDDVFMQSQTKRYEFPRQERGALFWYHDHVNMATRLGVYAGLAGLYIVRDEIEQKLGLPIGYPLEIPLLLQDRMLEADASGTAWTGRLLYKDPGHKAFEGDQLLVNGVIRPYALVEPREYRLRILNGANSRSFQLMPTTPGGSPTAAKMTQIGVDGGFLPNPVVLPAEGLRLMPAERADVILDLANCPDSTIHLRDDGTGETLLELRISSRVPFQPIVLPASLPTMPPLDSTGALRRVVVLMEDTNAGMFLINGKRFTEPVDDLVQLGTKEIWEFINATGDVHPMHLHLVHFQIMERQRFQYEVDVNDFLMKFRLWQSQDPATRTPLPPGLTLGSVQAPASNELGPKDTVRAPPRQITRVIARFEPHTGDYIYHCHLLEHEDMDMMRPFRVIH